MHDAALLARGLLRSFVAPLTLTIVLSIGLPALATPVEEAVGQDYEDHLEALFVHLHRNPELSYLEQRTAERLAEELRATGARVTPGVGGTGVVAVLENGAGPRVLVRADMDGLPIREDSGLAYASTATQRRQDGEVVPVEHRRAMSEIDDRRDLMVFQSQRRECAGARRGWAGTPARRQRPRRRHAR